MSTKLVVDVFPQTILRYLKSHTIQFTIQTAYFPRGARNKYPTLNDDPR